MTGFSAKKGLVLEGGAMRGLFTAGIIDVFLENDINFDGIVGVSAGACFGCNLKSRQHGRSIRYNRRFAKDPRYSGWRCFLRTGDLFGAEFCYHRLPTELDPFDEKTFMANPAEFYVVCTDLVSGQPVYHLCEDAGWETMEWIRASASMPLVSNIVEIRGGKYLDGAVSDSIPLKFFQEKGYEKNVVILTQPDGYEKGPTRAMPLIRLSLRKYPKFLTRMAARHVAYNCTMDYIRQCEAEGSALVIRPECKLPISRLTHDPDKMQEVYDIGRDHAIRRLDEIRNFLNR